MLLSDVAEPLIQHDADDADNAERLADRKDVSSVNGWRQPSYLGWQGWLLRPPGRSSPIKIDGGFNIGHVLMSDLRRPRLGLRWQRVGKRKDPAKVVRLVMSTEVGQLAAADAKPMDPGNGMLHGLLYQDDDPVRRDIWVGYSPQTRRVVQLSFPIEKRERASVKAVIGSLVDQDPAWPTIWSVFDLQMTLPPGMRLLRHRLNSGDLGLTFYAGRHTLSVRQVGPASVAVGRMSINSWLANQEKRLLRHYVVEGEPESVAVRSKHGILEGVHRNLTLRKRYLWVWSMARRWTTACLRDESRDRLILLQSTSPYLIAAVATGVGRVDFERAVAPEVA